MNSEGVYYLQNWIANMSERRRFIKKLTGLSLGCLSAGAGLSRPIREYGPESVWELVRRQFPVTQVKTYFNTGTMGPSPYSVIDKVRDYHVWMEKNGVYKGTEEARTRLAGFLGAEEAEISLTHNTTEGINIMAWGFPLKAGDEVITSHT